MFMLRHEGREGTRSGKMGQKWQGEGRACAKALRGGESLACSNSGKVASEGAGVVCQGEGNTKIPPQNSFPVISRCSLFGLKWSNTRVTRTIWTRTEASSFSSPATTPYSFRPPWLCYSQSSAGQWRLKPLRLLLPLLRCFLPTSCHDSIPYLEQIHAFSMTPSPVILSKILNLSVPAFFPWHQSSSKELDNVLIFLLILSLSRL